jgi:carbonic anhydrase
MIKAKEALKLLIEGNQRFVSGVQSAETFLSRLKRSDLVSGQEPFAVILGCSDSRVPVEIVFDRGLGDLFVIRVAGNIVAPSQIGSVEFAAETFKTRLVVIMGHTRCGAIKATLDDIAEPNREHSKNLRSIVDRIRPALEGQPDLQKNAVRINVRYALDALRHGSPIIEGLIQNDGLMVVGAEYSLETGAVEFFDVD